MVNGVTLRIGIKLELEVVNSLGDRIGQVYISQLMDILDESNIVIAAPIHESRLMLITPGTKIRIVLLDSKHGLVSLNGAISLRERKENIICLHAKMEQGFEKIQRRNYYRLDCILNALYSIYEGDPAKDQGEFVPAEKPLKALTKNISGNGACIVTLEEVPKGTYIHLTIHPTGGLGIRAFAKVIRCTLLEGLREKKYELGLYLVKISPKDQEALVKFIFDQQRLLLKNNLADKN